MPRRELVRQRLRGFTFTMDRSSTGSPESATASARVRPGRVASPMLSMVRLLRAARPEPRLVVGMAALRVGLPHSYARGGAFQIARCEFHSSKLYPNSFAGRRV